MIVKTPEEAKKALKKLRKDNRLTQGRLSSILYKSRNYVYEIEKGRRIIDVPLLVNYSTIFNKELIVGSLNGKSFDYYNDIFRDMRIFYGKTQLQLSIALTYDQTSISALENGHIVPKLWHLCEYTRIFGCKIGINKNWRNCR